MDRSPVGVVAAGSPPLKADHPGSTHEGPVGTCAPASTPPIPRYLACAHCEKAHVSDSSCTCRLPCSSRWCPVGATPHDPCSYTMLPDREGPDR